MARSLPSTARIYQLKVTLKDIKPPIWRRVLVPADITLHRLHEVLQTVLGWTDSHLYLFEVGVEPTYFGDPELVEDWADLRPSRTTKLSRVAPAAGAKVVYEYDLGDSWRHDIRVEKVLPAHVGASYPMCLAGKRACPPEDCGGVWGYAELLEVIADPAHEEHESMMAWLGGSFDPEDFDLVEVNFLLDGRGLMRRVATK
jgi:hypothetical protein